MTQREVPRGQAECRVVAVPFWVRGLTASASPFPSTPPCGSFHFLPAEILASIRSSFISLSFLPLLKGFLGAGLTTGWVQIFVSAVHFQPSGCLRLTMPSGDSTTMEAAPHSTAAELCTALPLPRERIRGHGIRSERLLDDGCRGGPGTMDQPYWALGADSGSVSLPRFLRCSPVALQRPYPAAFAICPKRR